MSPSPTAAPPASTADSVPAAMRSDLVRTEQSYLGRKYIILKNPIGLSYFRLPVSHADAAACFDGRRSFRQVLDRLRIDSRYWKSRPPEKALQELIALAQQLAASGLLRVSGGSAVARAQNIKRAKKNHWFEISVGKVLYFRKSLFDPDRLLEAMLPWLRWIYTKPAMLLTLAFLAVTLIAAFRHWDEIHTHTANFFTFENLALTWVLFFGVKIVHEFGHGLTCKRFGGEVHEMGFMFILFTPYLFCNVSDSWLASKNARISVTAAGIFVELVLAAIATWLWLASAPGLFHQMCFNTMFLCSVSTVLFNANPLLKFDGYYIMTDLLEIPNLKQKSSIYITQWAQRTLLGIKTAVSRLATFEMSPWFGLYAVASYLYGWLILYNISHFLFDALKPYGLEVLSRTYVGLFLFVSLALPLYRLSMSVKNSPELRRQSAVRVRYLLLCVAAGLGVLFLIPWQDSVKRTVVIEHIKMDPIVPTNPGFLRQLAVHEGQHVAKGDLIAQLSNQELAAQKRDLELERELSEVKYRAAISSDRAELQQVASAHRKMVREKDEEIKGIDEKIAQLRLVAPRGGVIRAWRMKDLQGQYFSKERPVCEVGDASKLRAIIPLTEGEARRVAVGQKVRFRLFAEPGEEFHGTVTALPVSPLAEFSQPVLASLFGGDVPAEPHRVDNKPVVKPSIPYYEAEVAFDPGDWVLRPGMMGKARVYTGKTTLGGWLVERTLDWLNPEFRL